MDAPLAGLLVADLTQNVAGPVLHADPRRHGRGGREGRAARPRRRRARVGAAVLGPGERHLHERQPQQAEPRGRPQGATRGARSSSGWSAAPTSSCSRCGPAPSRSWGSAGRARAALNPRLVYCSITAFGTEGPLQDRPGLRSADAGLRRHHVGQRPSRISRPRACRVSIVDMGTGMWAVIGILAALRERDRTGPRRAGHHRAVRHRARVGRSFQMSQLPRHRRGAAAAGLGHRDDRALRGLPGRATAG